MKLLRDFPWWRGLCRLAAGRRAAPRIYAVTVPAPLSPDNVVELRRPAVAPQPAPTPKLPRAACA